VAPRSETVYVAGWRHARSGSGGIGRFGRPRRRPAAASNALSLQMRNHEKQSRRRRRRAEGRSARARSAVVSVRGLLFIGPGSGARPAICASIERALALPRRVRRLRGAARSIETQT